MKLSDKLLQKMKVKINPVGAWDDVWNSQDTSSKKQVSIWAPNLSTTMLHSNKVSIAQGVVAEF